MRLSRVLAVAALAVSALAACGPRRIPGTEIPDNSDTRAIVGVIDQYRQAAERRDADAVLALASKSYFDDSGTPDPADDVNYDQLRKRLTEDYAKIASMRMQINVRSIEVKENRANAFIYYEEAFRMVTKTGEVPKTASDVARMSFVREPDGWKFVSGL